MMKRLIIIFFALLSFVLVNNSVSAATDNVFVGMDTVAELDDLDFIAKEANMGEFEDGEILPGDLDFSRIQKIYIDTLPYLFNDEKLNAASLKELLNNSNYVYKMPIYREHETVFLTIAKGLELSPDVDLPEEGIAYIQERAGKWIVSDVGIPDKQLDPKEDYMGLMESYLKLKDIHNAEIYFVSSINPKSMMNAVCFTGKQTETGEDEIIFVAMDDLTYDKYGNLVVEVYETGEFLDISEAEYTYEELRKMNEEKTQNYNPELSGGVGGRSKITNYGVYFVIIAGTIIAAGTILFIRKKRIQR